MRFQPAALHPRGIDQPGAGDEPAGLAEASGSVDRSSQNSAELSQLQIKGFNSLLIRITDPRATFKRLISTATTRFRIRVMSASALPRPLSKREQMSPYKEGLPTSFKRIARRGTTWDLPRNFKSYKASSEHEMSIGGAATKCFLSVDGQLEGAFIAKFAHKNGEIETYTELFK